MTKYIVNTALRNLTDHPYGYNQVTLYIKIDINGNIDIKRQNQGDRHFGPGPIHDHLIINDNIPIPTYMINMIKHLIPEPAIFVSGSLERFLNIIESIKILKNDMKNNITKLNDSHIIEIKSIEDLV